MESTIITIKKINALIEKFAHQGFLVIIGFEFEFYLLENDQNKIEEIKLLLAKSGLRGFIKPEDIEGQFEICSQPAIDFLEDFDILDSFLKKIKEKYHINYEAKPFLDKAGNGLHINISLHDYQLKNLFGEDNYFNHEIKNKLMAHTIGGLLEDLKQNIKFYFPTQDTINRILYPDRNTPINISWGYNNRTTALRIPETPAQIKRIEHRVASSANNFYEVIEHILGAVLSGIERELTPQACTYGLAFDDQYRLEKFIDLLKVN